MSRRAVSLCSILAALAFVPAGSGEVRRVQRTFPGQPGAALKVDAYRGTIDVEASPDNQFHLEIVLDPETDSPAESERLLKNVQTEIKQSGPVVSVFLRNPRETGLHFEFSEHEPRVSIDCRFLVPPACDLDLATATGDITVGNLAGRLTAGTRHGTIFFRRIDGNVEANAEKGNIILSRCTGSARLTVLLGSIRAGTIVGRVEGRATNGDIEVQHALGGGSISVIAGDAMIGLPKGLAAPTRIDTDSGAILAQIDPQAHCSIQATSIWGRVHLSPLLTVAVQSGGDGAKDLAGKLNGGGPLLVLHANGGQIRIEPPKDWPQ
jgi:hypothetical protein